jgi:hypothetical protein
MLGVKATVTTIAAFAGNWYGYEVIEGEISEITKPGGALE